MVLSRVTISFLVLAPEVALVHVGIMADLFEANVPASASLIEDNREIVAASPRDRFAYTPVQTLCGYAGYQLGQ